MRIICYGSCVYAYVCTYEHIHVFFVYSICEENKRMKIFKMVLTEKGGNNYDNDNRRMHI